MKDYSDKAFIEKLNKAFQPWVGDIWEHPTMWCPFVILGPVVDHDRIAIKIMILNPDEANTIKICQCIGYKNDEIIKKFNIFFDGLYRPGFTDSFHPLLYV